MMRPTIALLSFLAAGGIIAFGIFPLRNEIRDARAEIDGLIREYDELQEIAGVRSKLTAEYNAIPSQDLSRLSSMLPSGFATGQYLKDIEALSARHGLFLQSIDFVRKDQPSSSAVRLPSQQRFTPLEVSFTVRGPYEIFRLFLVDLEKLVRITDVTNISFVAQPFSEIPESKAASPLFEYALRGLIYYTP